MLTLLSGQKTGTRTLSLFFITCLIHVRLFDLSAHAYLFDEAYTSIQRKSSKKTKLRTEMSKFSLH